MRRPSLSRSLRAPLPMLLTLLLASCGMMLGLTVPGPSDWPVLESRIVKIDVGEAMRICGSYACVCVDFLTNRGIIYTATDDENVIEHEKSHLRGEDHMGDTTMRDMFEDYKRNKANGVKLHSPSCINPQTFIAHEDH